MTIACDSALDERFIGSKQLFFNARKFALQFLRFFEALGIARRADRVALGRALLLRDDPGADGSRYAGRVYVPRQGQYGSSSSG